MRASIDSRPTDAAMALAGEFVQMHIDDGLGDVRLEVGEIAGGANH